MALVVKHTTQAGSGSGPGGLIGETEWESTSEHAITGTADRLIGTDGSGDGSEVTLGAGLNLASAALTLGGDLAAGFTSDDLARGTGSGTETPAPGTGEENFQTLTNNGAFTLAPPANSCVVIIHLTNAASAGAITTSGFTVVDGDALTTTDTDEFILTIIKINDVSWLNVKALQ